MTCTEMYGLKPLVIANFKKVSSAEHNLANLRMCVTYSSTVSVSSCFRVKISAADLNFSVSVA